MAEIDWTNFDVDTERVYTKNGVTKRVQVPERVIALRTMEPTEDDMNGGDAFASRKVLAFDYAHEGDIIDMNIDVWGWGAANTYSQRRGYGYETVPDVLGHARIHTPPDPIPTGAS